MPTVSSWLGILEVTGQIVIVPPYYENFGKRLVKSPKLYFLYSGLACHLLGLESEDALARSPFLGPVFEGFVASEIVKHQINGGRARSLYYFRVLLDLGDRRLALIEAKATRTPTPQAAEPMLQLQRNITGYDVRRFVVHRPSSGQRRVATLAPGVQAVPCDRIGDLWR